MTPKPRFVVLLAYSAESDYGKPLAVTDEPPQVVIRMTRPGEKEPEVGKGRMLLRPERKERARSDG